VICLVLKKDFLISLFWVALIVIGPIYRSYYAHNEIITLYGYLSCFDSIALGCLSALLANPVRFVLQEKTGKIVQVFAAILMVSIYFYSGIMDNIGAGVSWMAAGTAILLIKAHQKTSFPFLSQNRLAKLVCWFGKNSYEFYLFHILILCGMRFFIKPQDLNPYTKVLWMLVYFVLSAFVAEIISRFYSEPLNRVLRQNIFSLKIGGTYRYLSNLHKYIYCILIK